MTITDTADGRAEKAFAAYIRGFRDPEADSKENPNEIDLACIRSGALEGVPVHEGRQTTERKHSAIVVSCEQASRVVPDAHWWSAQITIALFTHRNEDKGGTRRPEILHASRELAISDLLHTDETIKLGINKPVYADERDVKGFTVLGIEAVEIANEINQNVFAKVWTVTATVCAYDAV